MLVLFRLFNQALSLTLNITVDTAILHFLHKSLQGKKIIKKLKKSHKVINRRKTCNVFHMGMTFLYCTARIFTIT